MSRRRRTPPFVFAFFLLAAAEAVAGGNDELAVHVGVRFGGDVDAAGIDVETTEVAPSFGLVWDHEFRERRVVWSGWSFQPMDVDAPGLLPDRDTVDLGVHYLHVGTAYRGRGGNGKQGFVMFGLGLTWVDPPSEFDSGFGGSFVVGGGFRFPIRPAVSLRVDARGYTTFTKTRLSGVCGGVSCTLDFSGSGGLQVEALAGISFAF